MIRRLGLACAAATVLSCAGDLPGGDIGTYRVTSKPQSNTCGVGPGQPDPWISFVRLSKDDHSVYWSWQDGTPPAAGTLASPSVKLAATRTDTVSACTIRRDDVMDVTLGTDAHPASFTGTITWNFSVADGSCTRALTSGGGPYDALPCAITYDMTAARH